DQRDLLEQKINNRFAHAPRERASARSVVTIPVHVHVINKGEGVENGDPPDQMIEAQIDHFNETYKAAGFHFELASIDRTTNPGWHSLEGDSDEQAAMVSSLHQGGMNELNLYLA